MAGAKRRQRRTGAGGRRKEFFPVLELSREDLAFHGYHASKLKDYEMDYIAQKVGDVLVSGGDYYEALRELARGYGLPPKCRVHHFYGGAKRCETCGLALEDYRRSARRRPPQAESLTREEPKQCDNGNGHPEGEQ